ncbi:MAG: radical SAM protein [Candidatus Omnitrophota bacterium]
MKILFVYPGYIVREVPLNLMYISAACKSAGHGCELFHFTPYKKYSWYKDAGSRIERAFMEKIGSYKPDIVAFSVIIQDYDITRRLSSISKNRFSLPVIWGGIQPILEPERSIAEEGVDYICTGEGEQVFVEFLSRLENQKDVHNIEGIWAKDKQNNIHRNGCPRLIDNLDNLPFPDRDLFGPEYYRAELTGANILTARGCPFLCSFCQNKALMEHYKGRGRFVRYRSIENVLSEIEHVIDRYQAPSFYFSDEMFTLNRQRAMDFCKEYKKRIKKPFMIQTRADYMDTQLAKELAGAGCFMVNMAIESGNEYIRNTILKKNISTERIVDAYKIVHKHGMMSASFNMIGVPTETVRNIWETIEINRRLRPDRIMCSIFMPLPGTELGYYCRRQGLVAGDAAGTTNYYSQVIVDNPNISARTLMGYQGFFDWFILLPRWLFWLAHIFRLAYQSGVSPKIPGNLIIKNIREITIEKVYQMKRFLPRRRLHLKTR